MLGHHSIWGNFTDASTWDEVDELLRTTMAASVRWPAEVDAAFIDAGDGDHYDTVLNFCVPKMSRRVFAGQRHVRRATGFCDGERQDDRQQAGADRRRHTEKRDLRSSAARPRGIRFSHSLEPIYYEQLASERRVVRYSRGQPVRRFERIGRIRAEALDCLTYANAARRRSTFLRPP